MSDPSPAGATRRTRSLGQMWRTTLRGRCPACDEGRIFEGSFDVLETCPHCGAHLRPAPGSHYGGPMVLAYGIGTLAAFGVGGLLWWRFGIFARMELIMAAAGGLGVLLAYRPARAWWTWLLWRVGSS